VALPDREDLEEGPHDLGDVQMSATPDPSPRRSDRRFLLLVGTGLVALSVVIYVVNYFIFYDGRDLFFYLLIDLAFLPIEVLVVGVIVERLISRRDKSAIAQKLNMVIGAFFSELGTPLLAQLLPTMCEATEISEQLHLKASWKKEDFSQASRFARNLQCEVDLAQVDLYQLRAYLMEKRDFVLRLLENPNLIEHDRFTDLLWAVMHVIDELEARSSLTGLPPTDEAHLRIDIRRAYNALMAEWIIYAEHLKTNYPYLFSLVVRTHPFQEAPAATVTG
jgi:hypothetical protein